MKPPGTILLVDDETGFRENVAERLESRGYRVLHAENAEAALSQVGDHVVEVALVDIRMPGMDGLTLLGRLKEIDPSLEVVIVTGQGSIEVAVEAMQRGAYHFVTKPVRLKELEILVQKAVEKTLLSRQNSLFREGLKRRRGSRSGRILAFSSAMRQLLLEAARIAQTEATVVIEGETGTGKEALAEYIHEHSPRRERLFSVLNCGALTETLVDSELFGHEKGAFTGAMESRPGIFEVTDGGTLLLDEVGEMTPSAQVRLLRVLERGLCRRVGSTRERAVDVRLLAATHRDLASAVAEGKFREDLFHRLKVFSLRIPPLRERREDVLPLARHFLAMMAPSREPAPVFGPQAEKALLEYAWPGNVRELAHAVERGWFMAHLNGKSEIDPADLGLIGNGSPGRSCLVSLEEAQRRHIRDVLNHLGDNRQKAAQVLGVSERHLYRLLQRDKELERIPPLSR